MDAAPTIDAQVPERVEGWISELSQKIGEAELVLALLGGFCDEGLGQAIVGAMGVDITKARQQVGPLRQAVRDMEVS